MEDAKGLGKALSNYTDEYFTQVMLGFVVIYILYPLSYSDFTKHQWQTKGHMGSCKTHLSSCITECNFIQVRYKYISKSQKWFGCQGLQGLWSLFPGCWVSGSLGE